MRMMKIRTFKVCVKKSAHRCLKCVQSETLVYRMFIGFPESCQTSLACRPGKSSIKMKISVKQ